MLERLRNAPGWVLALVLGVYFGSFMAVFGYVRGASARASLVGGVVAGALFGVFMSRWIVGQRRAALQAISGREGELVPSARRRALARAASRGPVPGDPADREAAARLARYRLAQYERQRPWAPLFYLALVVLAAWLAVTDSPLWALAALGFAAFLVAWVIGLRRLRERVDLLEGTAS